MTPLRKRMTEDLQLKGYSPATQCAYLHAVEKLARHFNRSPADISEEDLRGYFLQLIQVEHCAPGTLRIAQAGLKFCFAVTLQRHWPALGLLRAGKEKKLPVVLSRAEVRGLLGCVRVPVYRVCLNTIYACGLRISEGAALPVSAVDGERKVLRVRGKGNKDRQVPLAESTLESLRGFWQLHRSKPWLFPARLQPRSPSYEGPVEVANLRRAFQGALAQSGVNKPATVHCLRQNAECRKMPSEAGRSVNILRDSCVLGRSTRHFQRPCKNARSLSPGR